MPIQAPQWCDYLNCPVCCREFGASPRTPISLTCGHTLCKHCLAHLHRKQCPFDQSVINVSPEEAVVNTALLQLAGVPPPAQPQRPPAVLALPESDQRAYDDIVRCMEDLAAYLKYSGNTSGCSSGGGNGRLSRPMQRKLVTLIQCCITDTEGRARTARAARSLAERTVTELILQHQNPQQLSANLWAAVRARGCQFLGPAMQEEVLKLVLLALEDGSALSRKVLVMFVVQRLEPHFPQASKTSIGHVVQLLYRASCFKVSKRECDSSLMQLKEEFRSYETLRREHDAQIVQIATEAGLRIAPDQWSALLYGDTAHKSHMQSIIDKLQTPQSFGHAVQELFVALQRSGDHTQLLLMSAHLERLVAVEVGPDTRNASWSRLSGVMSALREVVATLMAHPPPAPAAPLAPPLQLWTGPSYVHEDQRFVAQPQLLANLLNGNPQPPPTRMMHAEFVPGPRHYNMHGGALQQPLAPVLAPARYPASSDHVTLLQAMPEYTRPFPLPPTPHALSSEHAPQSTSTGAGYIYRPHLYHHHQHNNNFVLSAEAAAAAAAAAAASCSSPYTQYAAGVGASLLLHHNEPIWSTTYNAVFQLEEDALSPAPALYPAAPHMLLNAEVSSSAAEHQPDDGDELEEEILALERRLDVELNK